MTLARIVASLVAGWFPSAIHVEKAKPRPKPRWYHAIASYYDDSGATASGWHAAYGVASRTLPFGTRIRFRYGGREVTGIVDDRGPFVYDRLWDLNERTRATLGCPGLCHLLWRPA